MLDTDVVIAAMRSPRGASAAILRLVREGHVTMLLSVPLALEYEAVCRRAEHWLAAGLEERGVVTFVNAVIAMAKPVEMHFLWRPQLRDPEDEMVLEVAINGNADAMVTFNVRDYGRAPHLFGIDVLLPRDVIERMRA